MAFLLAGGEPMASLHLAVQKLGAAAVPLSIRFGPAELAYCVNDADPRMVIGDDTTSASLETALAGGPPIIAREELDELAQREPDGELTAYASTNPEDLSVILYTSGTTGRPKGVPRTHRAEHAAAVAHVIQTQHRPGEVTLGVMPLFHTMGVRTLLASILVAGTWVPQARFDAEESLELITTGKISALYLVPTIYWSLLRTGRLAQAKTVKRVAYAGAPMTPALAAELHDALRPEVFVNHFGSTEIYTFTIGPQRLEEARLRRPRGRVLPGPPGRPARPRDRRPSRNAGPGRGVDGQPGGVRRRTGTARMPTPARSATGGTSPATWPPRTRTAICGSAAGSTT